MLELARLLRLNPLRRWWTIELPSSAPYLFAGLRVGAIQATVGAIVAEWMAGDRGLGFLMIFGSTTYRAPLLIAAVVLTVALGIAVHQLVVWLESAATRWQEATSSGRNPSFPSAQLPAGRPPPYRVRQPRCRTV